MTSNDIDASTVQEVLNNLVSTFKAIGIVTELHKIGSSAEESFKAAIAQHLTESSAVSTAEPMDVDHPLEHTQREDLERIAEHVRQDQTHEPPTLQDQHEVLKHIGDSSSTLATVPITPESESSSAPAGKPVAGSEEWHKLRRDNHKEVERRRRETINHGITELATIIACTEKNKGQILKEAVKYIQNVQLAQTRLTEEVNAASALKIELANMELEKQVAEGALESLSMDHAQLKRDFEELVRQKEQHDREDDEELARKKLKTE
ncbi:basic helix-loop-helix protein [Podila clonocystis]|nr:basic helix-loop-helix protein [Podila clonocystis]